MVTPTQEQVNHVVAFHLIHNRSHLGSILKPLTDTFYGYLKDEPKEFHDDIKKEYADAIRRELSVDIQNNYPFISPEMAAIALDDLNIFEYMDVKL